MFRGENFRLKEDFTTKGIKNDELRNQITVLQRQKEKDQRSICLMMKKLEDLKTKISEGENQRSKISSDYQNLRMNMARFVKSHEREIRKIVHRVMKRKEEKLRALECIHNKKLQIAARILEDYDEDLFRWVNPFLQPKS